MITRSISLILFLGTFPSVGVSADDGSVAGVFRKHCVGCHGRDGKVKGKVNLLEIEDDSALLRDPRLLQKIVGALFHEAVSRMVAAFERRATALFGPAKG